MQNIMYKDLRLKTEEIGLGGYCVCLIEVTPFVLSA